MMGGGQSQGQLDASVLDRIFVGELDANSVVEETEYGAQITLGEHEHYSKHLKLARISAALTSRHSLRRNLTALALSPS